MPDTFLNSPDPSFNTWTYDNLVSFAQASNILMKQQQEAIEQLRLDLKDAMAALRKAQLAGDDWK